jgi:hypothetical protein
MNALQAIVTYRLAEDDYGKAIYNAAHYLCNTGRYGWTYITQYISGSTVWYDDKSKSTILLEYNRGYHNVSRERKR